MTSTVIAPQGSQRPGRFSRIEEYIFYGFFGKAQAVPTGDTMIATTDDAQVDDELDESSNDDGSGESTVETKVTWDSLIRRGTDATRTSREDMFYPIVIDQETHRVIEIGNPPGAGNPIPDIPTLPENYLVKWPIRSDNTEGRWQLGRDTFFYRACKWDGSRWKDICHYLPQRGSKKADRKWRNYLRRKRQVRVSHL